MATILAAPRQPVELMNETKAEHPGATMRATLDAAHVSVGAGATIADDVVLRGNRIVIGADARVERGVVIEADDITIGQGTVVEHGTRVRAISGRASLFHMGDFGFLGFEQNILVPVFRTGDYTAIHNRCLISGYEPFTAGHNCWIGQDTILNATKALTLGNGVRIGTGSRLWTHVASGELMEGCTMYGEWPLVLEDDVWVVGGGIVSPNLVVARGTVLMTGGVLTKSTEPRHVYAGVPAKDVSDKLRVYKDVTLEDKHAMMLTFLHEFHASTKNVWRESVVVVDNAVQARDVVASLATPAIVVQVRDECFDAPAGFSVFSLETKRYRKQRTKLEQSFIRFHVGHRARFNPI